MILVDFDQWKKESDLEGEDCENCAGHGYIECWECGHDEGCDRCTDGLIEPDYSGEYLKSLLATIKKLNRACPMSLSKKKGVLVALKETPELMARLKSMKEEA